MSGFSEWIVLESLLDELETKMLLERAALDTLSMVVRAIRESDEEDDDAPAVLDDPFSGDEDAKPKEMSPEAQKILDNPVQDSPAPKAPSKGYVRSEDHSEDLRKMAAALKIIKADAIRDRAEEVEKMADFLKEVEDAMDSSDLSGPSADPAAAIPKLAKLGYFGKLDGSGENKTIRQIKSDLSGEFRQKLIKRRGGSSKRLTPNDKKRIADTERAAHDKLMDALSAAAKEKGNEPPQGGFPNRAEVLKAKEDFGILLKKVLGGRFRDLARGNQRSLGSGRVGHQLYEPDDLSDQVTIGLLRHFTTRSWSGKGKDRAIDPWSKNDSKLNMDPDKFLAYLIGTANKEPRRENENRTRQLSPASKESVKAEIKNAKAKAGLISADLKSGEFSFYRSYLRKAKERPLASRQRGEILVSPADGRDRLRASIMRDIESEARLETPGISLDPDEIRDTLISFMHLRLAPQYRQVVHASTLAKDDDSSEDAILSASERRKDMGSAEFSHSLESDDEFDSDSTGDDPMATGQSVSGASSGMLFELLKPFIIKSINDIAQGYTPPKNPAGKEKGPREALALCIKFGIPCNVTTKEERGNVVPATVSAIGQGSLVLDDRLKDLFRQASEREGWSWEAVCRSAFQSHGINPSGGGLATIASKWPEHPKGAGVKLSSMNFRSMGEYLNGTSGGSSGGLVKLCNRMSDLIRF